MKIESTKSLVNAPAQTVFDFLINAENLFHIMPQDKMSDWKADEKSCSFKAQGGFLISLTQIDFTSPTQIVMKSGEKSPFQFTLTVHLKAVEDKTEGYIAFDGELNAFMKMMVEKPLTNLFNYMSVKLQKYYDPEI
jgi:carbon monoxide dehydrogenase subunit G